MTPFLEPTPEQLAVVEKLSKRHDGYVVGAPGAGKTITMLLIIKAIGKRAVIFAPPRVVGSAWEKTIKTWPQLAGLDYCVLRGTAAQRRITLQRQHTLLIVSDNLVDWLVETAIEEKISLGDVLVIDEITRWSTPGAVRVGAIRKYTTKNPQDWTYRYVMTATPVSEGWQKLYTHFILLDRGARLGTNKEQFLLNYFQQIDHNGRKYRLLPGAAEQISNKISDAICELPATQHYIPPLTVQHHTVALSREIQDCMRLLRRDRILNVSDEQIICSSSDVLRAKLEQIVCGAVYRTEDAESAGVCVELHTSKIEKVKELVAKKAPQNVIIVYWFQFELAYLLREFPDAGVLTGLRGAKLDNAINQHTILLLHPRSGGHGVDGLQFNYSHMIWTAPTWSRDLWTQTCGRVWRRGQKNPVTVDVLHAENSIDGVKWAVCDGKGDFIELFEKHLLSLKEDF